MFRKFGFILFFFLLINNISLSKNNFFILATVNDEIITNYDIDKEIEYLKLLNPSLSKLNKEQIFKISKDSLINEIIKNKEIKKFLKSEENNTLVNDTLKKLYKRLNFQNEKDFQNFLSEKNSYNIDEIKEKLEIEILWNELIYLKYNNQVRIDKELFSQKIDDMKNKKINEYLLSEIVFQKKSGESFDLKVKKIFQSIEEIGFDNTANILSVSETSKLGGRIGWVSEPNLSEIILNNLKKINIGEYTNIIKVGNNFLILKIEEKRLKENSINKDEELNKLMQFEMNKQLNQFSRIYFNKSKINYSINEK